jgi:hypothetical protein
LGHFDVPVELLPEENPVYESPRIADVQTITSAYGSGLLPQSAGASGCALVVAVVVAAVVSTNVAVVNVAVKVNVAASVNVMVAGNASLASPRKQPLQTVGKRL